MHRLSGLVRITSGEFRGRAIKSPAGGLVHPMGSRERLSLLNSLSPYLGDAYVLDAFAGTGALGLEALSRGAMHATFVENNAAVVKILKENIHLLGLDRQATVLSTSVENLASREYLLSPRSLKSHSFHVILADPPYGEYDPATIAPLETFLRPGGVLALSHPKGSPAPTFLKISLKSFHLYAGCRISIFA